jgi:hypothetical protein
MGERLTRSDIATHFGVSVTRIGQLIGEGRLKEERATIDLEEAEALWASMDPDYKARAAAQKAAKENGEKTSAAFNAAKARHQIIKTRQAELELNKRTGLLVERNVVTQQAYTASKLFMNRLSQVPRQLAPQLALLTDPAECERLLSSTLEAATAEIRNALAELGTPEA